MNQSVKLDFINRQPYFGHYETTYGYARLCTRLRRAVMVSVNSIRLDFQYIIAYTGRLVYTGLGLIYKLSGNNISYLADTTESFIKLALFKGVFEEF